MFLIDSVILGTGILLLLGIASSKLSSRLGVPVLVRAGEAVHEYERRCAAAPADEVHGAPYSTSACGLCPATSLCCSCGGAAS